MTNLADIDYFTDADIAQGPYEYWDYLPTRDRCSRSRATG